MREGQRDALCPEKTDLGSFCRRLSWSMVGSTREDLACCGKCLPWVNGSEPVKKPAVQKLEDKPASRLS